MRAITGPIDQFVVVDCIKCQVLGLMSSYSLPAKARKKVGAGLTFHIVICKDSTFGCRVKSTIFPALIRPALVCSTKLNGSQVQDSKVIARKPRLNPVGTPQHII